ncbi:MAG: MFS transporter, partial [Pseudomonadota bacterium]
MSRRTFSEPLLVGTLGLILFVQILDVVIMYPLGALMMNSLHFNLQAFTVLVAAYSISAAVAGVIFSFFIDYFERRRTLMITITGFAVATLLCGLVQTPYAFLICRCIAGVFGGILAAQIQTIVADVIPVERRGRAMGTIMTAHSLSSILGIPLSLLLAEHAGWRAPFVAVAVIAALLLIATHYIVPVLNEQLPSKQTINMKKACQHWVSVMSIPAYRAGLLLGVANMLAIFMVLGLCVPYIANNLGFGAADLSLIYLVGGSITLITSRLIGWLSDAYHPVSVFTALCIFGTLWMAGMTVFPLLPFGITVAYAAVLMMFNNGRIISASVVVSKISKPESRGTLMAIQSALQQIAIGIGVILSGLLVETGPQGEVLHYPRTA